MLILLLPVAMILAPILFPIILFLIIRFIFWDKIKEFFNGIGGIFGNMLTPFKIIIGLLMIPVIVIIINTISFVLTLIFRPKKLEEIEDKD